MNTVLALKVDPYISSARERIEWIDCLRGLAAVAVMILHFYHQILIAILPSIFVMDSSWKNHPQNLLEETLNYYNAYAPNSSLLTISHFIFSYFDLGKVGVLVFFLISGFVIPYSISKKHRQPIKCFAVSRFFRLYPIYWFSLFIIGLVIIPFFTPDEADWKLYLLNLTMFQKFFLQEDINGVAWTLQLELIFYFSCAFLFWTNLLKNRITIIFILAIFISSALGGAIVAKLFSIDLPLGLPLGLSYMWLGYCSRAIFLKTNNLLSRKSAWLIIAISLPIILLSCYLGYDDAGGRYMNTYSIALIIYVTTGLVFKPASGILQWLGRISYSLYLLHGTVAFLFLDFFIRTLLPQPPSDTLDIMVPLFATACASIIVAHLTYRYIESPSIQLGRRVIKRINEQSKIPAKERIEGTL
jgi:peptidoglycan/LPS O-acetylase OafA/YrhL